MISFTMIDIKIRFAINPSAVETASLQISSRPKKLADVVENNNDQEN